MQYYLRLNLLVFIISAFIWNSSAQTTINGKVINTDTGDGIPYVSIGILGESIGTVSSIKGIFELDIDDKFLQSKIVFSAIGYESLETTVNEIVTTLSQNKILSLNPVVYEIEEIVVSKQKLKRKTLGNVVTKTNVQAGYKDNILGCEVATKINLKRREQVLLSTFKFHIGQNTCDSLFFRLNFYENNKGEPGKNITKQNIVITTNVTSGIVEVDLESYDIWMKDDFFVGLEWIRNFCPEQEKGGFNFASKLFKKLHYKPAGKANWSKLSIAGVGMWIDVFSCKKEK